MKEKDYEVFVDGISTIITTKTKREALAYACGVLHTLRSFKRAGLVEVTDGKNIIFSQTC